MQSMYEQIMDLVLFKGISREQVSELVEKNCVVFESFRAGESIVTFGQEQTRVLFIVSGNARMTTVSADRRIAISQTISVGAVIGADALFGWEITATATIDALTDLSALVFDKEQYVRLLKSDDIYLLNYLNYLALNMHNARRSVRAFPADNVAGLLGRWLLTATHQNGSNVMVHATIADLSELTGIPEERVGKELKQLQADGLLLFNAEQGHIRITGRREFIEYLDPPLPDDDACQESPEDEESDITQEEDDNTQEEGQSQSEAGETQTAEAAQ